ncbi:hypothetical protein O6V14_12120 [Sphingomonas faeni]|uniref:hypothetical protein n=1 Tax=Sphingomonas faeni TaxID=185950 RepID=UPI0033485810
MTALTPRQTVKVKAALSLIAVHGHNPRSVQKQAQDEMAKGYPANAAYSTALNAFSARVPALKNTLEIAVDLIHNSDDATVSMYDKALSAYNNTGDESHLDNLAPMILEDAKALAISKGEVTEADAASWTVDDALGSTVEAYAETPDVPEASSIPPGEVVKSSFGFNIPKPNTPQPAQQPAQAQQTGPQWIMGPTGYTLVAQAPTGPQTGQSMTSYDPYKGGQDVTGIRVAQTGVKARQSHGTPVGDVAGFQTDTGYRVTPTGEQARREAGVPLGPDAY